ncbi:MAG: tetratricopeptide repeat protein [Bryobacteraceae bacterium]
MKHGTVFHVLVALLSTPLLPAQDVRTHLDRAGAAQQRGDFQAAAKELQEAARLKPDEAETHARLGIVYRRLGMAAQATESLERAATLEPGQARVKVLLAFSYMDSGRFKDAIPLLAASFEAEQKDSVKAVVGQRLVEAYLAIGAQEQALPALTKLREIAPGDPAVLYLASKVYMNLWNDTFQQMLAKAPASYQMHLIQAEALEAQEKYAEAAQHYRQILAKTPIPGIHYRLGAALLRSSASGETDQEALAEFQKELALDPMNAAALTATGDIQLRSDRRSEAAESFVRAAKLQPAYVPPKVGLAKVLIAEKQWARALEQLDAALKLAPADEPVHYNLMLVYRALGRAAEAKQAGDTFQRLKERRQQSGAALLKGPAAQ